MPRTFAYVRVSTTGQTTENQVQEIEAAGFKVEPRRIVTETVSGSTAIAQRRGFSRLMDKLESGDILIVTKLDRLGRDAIDVSTTVRTLAELGVRVYCLALGGADLTSSAGTMTMNVLNAVAQFERDLLIERTQFGLKRAKSEGKTLGRPFTLSDEQKQGVRNDLATGMSVSAIARKFATSRQTIMRGSRRGFTVRSTLAQDFEQTLFRPHDPNLLFVRPIPTTTKIVGGQDLNGRNYCSA